MTNSRVFYISMFCMTMVFFTFQCVSAVRPTLLPPPTRIEAAASASSTQRNQTRCSQLARSLARSNSNDGFLLH
jgi:ABC-type nitrate/sulfonate/bicarbonate transport system permease component